MTDRRHRPGEFLNGDPRLAGMHHPYATPTHGGSVPASSLLYTTADGMQRRIVRLEGGVLRLDDVGPVMGAGVAAAITEAFGRPLRVTTPAVLNLAAAVRAGFR